MAQIAAQELKEIGMDVSVEIPAQTDWAGPVSYTHLDVYKRQQM